MKRALKGLGWGLLALLLAIALMLGWVVGTESGSRWALGRVPGLTLTGFEGRLGGHWQAERLVWQQDARRIEIEQPEMDWSPACLLRLTLCIESLTAGAVELVFPPTPEQQPPAEPFSLADIKLPLELRVGELAVGPVRFNGTEQLQRLRLVADWGEEGATLETLRLVRDDVELTLEGRLSTTGQWPLELQGTATLTAPEDQPWELDFAASGELRDQVALRVDSDGYFEGRLSGEVQPLAEHLPARLRLEGDDFKPLPTLPETLRLQDIELTLAGNLEQGYQVLGTTRLPAEGTPVDVALQGRVTASEATLALLEFAAGAERTVRLEGHVDWREALQAQAKLSWRDFAWATLYPDIAEPPVSLRTLDAEFEYDDGRYLGHFDLAGTGPAGDFTLQSPVSGDLEQVHFPDLRLQAGEGTASGSVSFGFAEAIEWKADLALAGLDPAYWIEALPGRLEGAVRSEGSLAGGLRGTASLDIDGTLRGQPAALHAEAEVRDTRWSLSALDLRVGDNRIQGDGHWGETVQARLELELARLGQLWPGLGGRLEGLVTATGTPEALSASARLDGTALAFGDTQVGSLALQAGLDEGERGSLNLSAGELRAAGRALGQLTIEAQGSLDAHRGQLRLDGPLAEVAIDLRGGLRDDTWHGQLTRAELEAAEQAWVLRETTPLTRFPDGRLVMGAHCWDSPPASLCGGEQRLLPTPDIDYRLRNFPLERIAAHLPQDVDWQGELNADLAFARPDSGPVGGLRIDAGPGTLRVREADRWIDFPYETLALDAELTPDEASGQLQFDGGALGSMFVQASVDPRGAIKPLRGEFRLTDLALEAARPFLPQVEQLDGHIEGAGVLTGTLAAPQIEGTLRLENGEIGGGQLPTSLEDLNLVVEIDGEALTLDGQWRSGEQGRGSLTGSLDWSDRIDLDARLVGERLPVVIEPYAEVEIAPNLRISLAGDQFSVAGRVEVPRGAIVIRDLPPSTVQVSEDAVIVGEEAEQPAEPVDIDMDVDVVVGEDRLTFSGFGLTALLRGFLHIGDDLDTRGQLNLVDGRYRAYGQRLTIRRARLLFTGPLSQPFLDIEAIRRIEEDDVIAGLRITGSAAQPQVEVFAEPAMSQEQALSYLVLGRPLGADTGDNNLLAQAALGLGLLGGQRVAGGFAERLGIENFQLDTQGSGTETRVVASGELTDRLTLRYGVGVFEAPNTFALRYQLTKRIFLEVASGLASSLDIFYRRDF